MTHTFFRYEMYEGNDRAIQEIILFFTCCGTFSKNSLFELGLNVSVRITVADLKRPGKAQIHLYWYYHNIRLSLLSAAFARLLLHV